MASNEVIDGTGSFIVRCALGQNQYATQDPSRAIIFVHMCMLQLGWNVVSIQFGYSLVPYFRYIPRATIKCFAFSICVVVIVVVSLLLMLCSLWVPCPCLRFKTQHTKFKKFLLLCVLGASQMRSYILIGQSLLNQSGKSYN